MKKLVIKYSKLSVELKKAVRQKLEDEDVKFFNFPYQGNIEEGFLFETEGNEVSYLVILDAEKKTKYKHRDDEEVEKDNDDFDEVAIIEKDLKVADADEFKVDEVDVDVDNEVDDINDVDNFDDDGDVDDIADEEFEDNDEK